MRHLTIANAQQCGLCRLSWCSDTACLAVVAAFLLLLHTQAAALLRRHPKVEELDLSGLDGSHTSHLGQPPVLSIRSFVLQVAPHLTKYVNMRMVGPLAAVTTCPSCSSKAGRSGQKVSCLQCSALLA